jgi:branched-chain amino acid transport system substrate-binding protein
MRAAAGNGEEENMRSHRGLSMLTLVTATAMLLGACTSASTPGASQAGGGASGATDTVNVSLLAPFSGSVASFGSNANVGLSLAFQSVNNVVNGHKLVIQKIDDQCKPDVAVTEAAKILDTAQVIVGPICSGDMAAVQASLQTAQIPHLFGGYLSSVMTKGDKYIFQMPPSDKVLMTGLIQWAKQNVKVNKWALLHDTSGYGAGGEAIFVDLVKAAGMTLTLDASYNGGEKDFTGTLLNLDKSGADAIHLIGYDTDLALITKQAKQLGIKTPIIGDLDDNTQTFLDAAAGTAEGQYFISAFLSDETRPAVASFVSAVKAAGGDTSGETANAYIAGLVLIDALKHITGPVTKANLTAAIAQVNIPDSPEGPISFGPDGQRAGTGGVVIGKIVNGKPTFYARI